MRASSDAGIRLHTSRLPAVWSQPGPCLHGAVTNHLPNNCNHATSISIIIIEIVHRVQHKKDNKDAYMTESLSANTVYSSGNIVIYKQTNTQIRVVSEQQHVL